MCLDPLQVFRLGNTPDSLPVHEMEELLISWQDVAVFLIGRAC